MNKLFKNKIILITGGTGSFGTAMVTKLLQSKVSEIRVYLKDFCCKFL